MKHWIKAFGPQGHRPPLGPALWAAGGVGFSLAMIAVSVVLAHQSDAGMIAPFGASAVLIFFASQGPFSQPWSVVVGNTASALVAAGLVWALPDIGLWLGPLAVAAALAVMIALRAVHPPGGAVALLVTITHHSDVLYAIFPVATGSVILVASAIFWGRLSRRHYPAKL